MTSSNGNTFLITGPLHREFTSHQWIPRTNSSFAVSLVCAWINGWVNNREVGDLRRHLVHYDVSVMACRHRSNCILVLDLTPGFNGLGKGNCKTRRKYFSVGTCWGLCQMFGRICALWPIIHARLITKISKGQQKKTHYLMFIYLVFFAFCKIKWRLILRP